MEHPVFKYTLSIDMLIQESFKIFKKHIGKIIPLIVFFHLPSIIASFTSPISEALMGQASAGTILLHVVAALLAIYPSIILMWFTENDLQNIRTIGLGKLIQQAMPMFFILILIGLVVTFILAAGFALFFIPGIILLIYLGFYQQAVVLREITNPVHVFKYSYNLVKGYFWQVFGKGFVFVITYFALPTIALYLLFLFTDSEIFDVLYPIVNAFASTLFTITWTIYFINLEAKQGYYVEEES